MSKVHVTVTLRPSRSGYWWSVPHPAGGASARLAPDVGSAVTAALNLAKHYYADMLGSCNFQLTGPL